MRVLAFFIIGAVIVATAFWQVPKYIKDDPSFFSRTAGYENLTDESHGFSFLLPPGKRDSFIVKSYPNPDRLTQKQWVDIKYEGQASSEATHGLFKFLKTSDKYIISNGYNMLEISIKDLSAEETNDVMQSWQVVKRTKPVELGTKSFAEVFDGMVYDNSKKGEKAEISGDEQIDKRIRDIGVGRGYKSRLMVDDASKLSEADGYQVRKSVAVAWKELQESARKEGIEMIVVSGYRDEVEQAEIFNAEAANDGQQLFGGPLTLDQKLGEEGEQLYNKVMETVAVPGYSKHHTGWTIDITQYGYNTFSFGSTQAFEWISKDNYLNARKYGFLPSYPEGGEKQGPEPEAWEYVFVGKEFLGF